MSNIFLKKAFRDFRLFKLRSIPLLVIIIIGGLFTLMYVSINIEWQNMEKYVWDGQHYHNVELTVLPENSEVLQNVIQQSISATKINVDYMFRARYDVSIQQLGNNTLNNTKAQLYILDPNQTFNVDTLYYYDGQNLTSFNQNKTGVGVIDYQDCISQGWENGNYFSISGPIVNYTIQLKGRVGSPEYMIKPGALADFYNIAVMPTIWMQTNDTNKGIPFLANDIVFYFPNAADKAPFMKDLLSRINNADITGINERQPFLILVGSAVAGLSNTMSLIFGIISCAMIYLMLKRQVEEENQTLGMFKALGLKNRELMESSIYYALIVSVTGSLLGLLLGVFSGQQLINQLLGQYIVFFPSIPGISFGGGLLLIYPLTVIILSVLGAILATRKIFKITPIKAIRPESIEIHHRKASLKEKWIRKIRQHISPLQKFSMRTIGNHRRKMGVILLGLILSTVITMFGISMISGYEKSMNVMFSKLDKWDLVVYMNGEVNENNINGVLSSYGISNNVESVEPFFTVPVRFSSDPTHLYTVTGYYQNSTLREFQNGISLKTGQMLFTKDLYVQMGLSKDNVIKALDLRGDEINFTVGPVLQEFVGNSIYTTIQDARMIANQTNSNEINGLMIKTTNPETVAQGINSHSNGTVQKVLVKSEFQQSMTNALGQKQTLLDGFFVAGLVIGIAITVMVVSTMISERKREFINFRAIGVTNQEIFSIVFQELVVVGVLGVGLGVLVSIPAFTALTNALTSFGVILSNEFTLSDAIVTIVAVLISIIIATWFSLRDLYKAKISEHLVSRVLG